MRVVGERIERLPGLRWPTPEEIRHTQELGCGALLYYPKGVVRYRSHDEANADMNRLIADAMARKALQLVGRKS